MPTTETTITVEPTTREVIERKLLAALDDGGQVAILATCDDLTLLINALKQFGTVKGRQWASDLERLRHEAFGGFPS